MAETLTKINFSNIEQFIEDINRNFATIQNSPLYKGIPGKTIIGTIGLTGLRGSQILFVNFNQFNTTFPQELSAASQINMNYINLKISTFENNQKLLNCFGIDEFVNNDIIVLTNSIMLSYNSITNLFIDTKISFNGQANLLSSIETQIENAITLKLSQNSTLNTTTNIFENFTGYLTSLPQNSNLPIINLPTAVYEPYINGTITGELLTTHKFFGFSETLFPNNYTGTTILGSIRDYFNLIEGTIDNNNNLTSDYAPGVNNIPTLVLLQDTSNAGILFGIKGKTSLQSFGSIYKDSEGGSGNVVIKSDSGILPGDFSILRINKDRLRYNKYVEIDDYLEVSNDLIIGGNISNQFIRTNQYSTANTIEIGSYTPNSTQRNISDNIQLTKFNNNNVLVTDTRGQILKEYSIENIQLPVNSYGLNLIDNDFIPTDTITKKFITSNYLNWIYNKFNDITSAINDLDSNININLSNYYTKNDFTNGNLKTIYNHGDFSFGFFEDLGSIFWGDAELEKIYIGRSPESKMITYGDLILDKIKNKIVTTDNNGKIVNTYAFTDYSIPDLTLTNSLIVGQSLNLQIFSINNTDNEIWIGKHDSTTETIVFGYFKPNLNSSGAVMVVGQNGRIATGVDEYKLSIDIPKSVPDSIDNKLSISFPSSTTDTVYQIGNVIGNRTQNSILNGLQLDWSIKSFDNIRTRFANTWNKTEVGPRMIGELELHIPQKNPLTGSSILSFFYNDLVLIGKVTLIVTNPAPASDYHAHFKIVIDVIKNLDKVSFIMTRNSSQNADQNTNDSVWPISISYSRETLFKEFMVEFDYIGIDSTNISNLYFKFFDTSSLINSSDIH